MGVYFGYMGAKPPGQIEPNFLEEGIRDVITCFKFGDDRFMGLASAEGQILPFPIDFDGRPYKLTHYRVSVWSPAETKRRNTTSGLSDFIDNLRRISFQSKSLAPPSNVRRNGTVAAAFYSVFFLMQPSLSAS